MLIHNTGMAKIKQKTNSCRHDRTSSSRVSFKTEFRGGSVGCVAGKRREEEGGEEGDDDDDDDDDELLSPGWSVVVPSLG